MTIDVTVTGVAALQQRVAALSDAATTSKVLRRGISAAMKLLADAQRAAAPVRKSRVRKRDFLRRLKRLKGKRDTFANVAKARKKASSVQKKFRSLKLVGGQRPQGPRELIQPGQLKRSIGYRVKVRKDGVIAKAGMNVGVRKSTRKYAHHAAIVGSLNHTLRKTKSEAKRGVMPDNLFIRTASAAVSGKALALLNDMVLTDMQAVAVGQRLAGAAT